MDRFNNWSNAPAYNPSNWYGYTPAPSSFPENVNTNVYKVTSLEEAIMRSTTRSSETVYYHQSKNEFYNVRVDADGNKSWQTFKYNLAGPEPVNTNGITKEMYDEIIARISALEEKHKEVSDNAQSNG